jgi:hypothetical protein
MQIGMLDHLQKWIVHFMKTHERLDMYNAICLSVPPYQYFTPENMLYEDVSQWNGKDMKEISRYLLGVVTQSLQGGSPTQRHIFNHAIQCTRAWFEFYMYDQYISHDETTLIYMEDASSRFHTFRDRFIVILTRKR